MSLSLFQGRSFLSEKDFTKEELEYLIDFSIHLKQLKKQNIPHYYLERKILPCYLKKHLLEPEQHLQQLRLI